LVQHVLSSRAKKTRQQRGPVVSTRRRPGSPNRATSWLVGRVRIPTKVLPTATTREALLFFTKLPACRGKGTAEVIRAKAKSQTAKPAAELRWLVPLKPTGLVFRPVCFKSLLITKRTRRQKGQRRAHRICLERGRQALALRAEGRVVCSKENERLCPTALLKPRPCAAPCGAPPPPPPPPLATSTRFVQTRYAACCPPRSAATLANTGRRGEHAAPAAARTHWTCTAQGQNGTLRACGRTKAAAPLSDPPPRPRPPTQSSWNPPGVNSSPYQPLGGRARFC
jgi:hypothetical protein